MEQETKESKITQEQLDAFAEYLRKPVLEPGEIKAGDLAEKANLSRRVMRDRLNWLVDQGVLGCRQISNEKAYKPVSGKTWLDAKEAMENRYKE